MSYRRLREALDRWLSGDPKRDRNAPVNPRPSLPEPRPSAICPPDLPDSRPVPPALPTVLIADEDAEFRQLVAMLLAPQGFRVYEAADVEEAWSLAIETRPWLILSEGQMPGFDGFELCRRVRAHSQLSHTPFLFVSALDNIEDRRGGLRVGADDYLTKQTPIRELLIRIQLLLTRHADVSDTDHEI